jgi:GT2 family glycosyltransferase
MPGDVTAIIPNWNGAGRLEKAIASLLRQSVPLARVLVVDNGSTDGSAESAAALGASVLRLDRNYGFSRAVNEGIRVCETDWVAILNNDIEAAPDWLERLLAAASLPDAWFACPRILSMNDPSTLDGTFDLLSRSGCAWRAGNGSRDSESFRQPAKVFFAPLTAALFRRELFERAGLLDERFESYVEDVEFGLRCAMLGLHGFYAPGAVVSHEGSATLGPWSSRMVRLISRNQVYLVARHYPRGWFGRFGRAVMTGQLLWGGVALRHGTGFAWLKGKLDGISGAKRIRETAALADADRLDSILRQCEMEIRRLREASGESGRGFWDTYFKWSS